MLDPSQVAAILFDIDGTLADSDDAMVDTVARVLSSLGWRTPERVARRLVMAFETPVNCAIALLDRLGLGDCLSRRREQACPEKDSPACFRIMPGLHTMLDALVMRYPLAIVTTRCQLDAETFLAQFDLSHYFRAVITRGSTRRLKPHPGPVRRAAELLSVPVERCLMVGDTTPDVRAARRAGALAVAVLCGYGERPELQRAGAHAIIERTTLLLTLLESGSSTPGNPTPHATPAASTGLE